MQTPKPSAIRNYLYEYVLIAFAGAIATLFYMYADLNKTTREVLINQINNNSEIMRRNSEALNQFLNYQHFVNPQNK